MEELASLTVTGREVGRVHVRPATPDDRKKLGDMLDRLSPQTIYERFHTPYRRVPGRFVDQFVGFGHYEGAFLVAVADVEVVGHAMYVGPDGGQGTGGDAEIAVVVEDGWQSRGVGKLLLRELAERARSRGVESFTGSALGENRRVLGLIRTLFPGAKYAVEDGSYLIHIPLRASERRPDLSTMSPAA